MIAVLSTLLAAVPGPAHAGVRTRYFELINRAHDSVRSLAVAPAGDDRFQVKPLGAPLAGGGGSATIQIAGDGCRYDFQVTFADGRTLIYPDIDVCRYRSLRIPPVPR
ncbi:hypothetical protein [Lysobacter sp. CA199]|uniref:hypothetical protein n=1 Tax=Lysobacter sp. CA199 TaxID=3455608 RepID=UPI003F8D2EF2